MTEADDVAVDDLAATAARAARAGGVYLRERFRGDDLDAEYGARDVKTAADREAERRVLDVIEDAYPDHRISTEESGEFEGTEPYRWIVDPLDGTNNFAIGLPVFGTAVAVVDERVEEEEEEVEDDRPRGHGADGEAVAAAVHAPITDDLYVARRGGGVVQDGRRIEAADGDSVSLSGATVGVVIGHDVKGDTDLSAVADAAVDAVSGVCKRHIFTWAPVVYWGLLARGRLDAYVCVAPDDREQVAGDLLARESGCARRGEGDLSVYAREEDDAEELWRLVRDAAPLE